MKKDIILSGVGGQGILSIAATIGYAAIDSGLFLKQSEVHGMSQRGGAVQSHFRYSDKEIASDLIPKGSADMIISVEPMEALRYVDMLTPEGWVFANSKPFDNIADYPDIETIYDELNKLPNRIVLDADAIARKLGSPQSANIVVLGAASPYLGLDFDKLIAALHKIFARKGEKILQKNIDALNAGRDFKMD